MQGITAVEHLRALSFLAVDKLRNGTDSRIVALECGSAIIIIAATSWEKPIDPLPHARGIRIVGETGEVEETWYVTRCLRNDVVI